MAEGIGQVLAFATLGFLTSYAAIVDARTQTIPDWSSVALLVGGLLVSATIGVVTPSSALAAAVLSGLLLWMVRAVFHALKGYDGLGFGDVKFVAAASTWIGVESVAFALLVASTVALIYVLLRQIFDRSFEPNARVPFCPFLALGIICVAGLQMVLRAPLFFGDVFG
jgi:leader peptidase (prepilin peptidase) / N-methyltransferase